MDKERPADFQLVSLFFYALMATFFFFVGKHYEKIKKQI